MIGHHVLSGASQLSCEDSQMSFERLLSVADSEGPTTSSSGKPHTSSNEAQQLHGELSKATKTIRGLNELLRESEESTVRLGEQAKLLKAEIRRLERNKEREEGVSNMEYLKNVVLKVYNRRAENQSGLTHRHFTPFELETIVSGWGECSLGYTSLCVYVVNPRCTCAARAVG